MSQERSPSSGQRYGLTRVCRLLGVPRSTLYSRRDRAAGTVERSRRRGPKPRLSDVELVDAIRADLSASPFHGEGHRKVWARLCKMRGLRVSRKRVLRLMREQKLLSPHRAPMGDPKLHDGTITTTTLDEMWATDAFRVQTVDDGSLWVFVAVDHFSAECIGYHVSGDGSRFAALQPVAMGLTRHRGGIQSGCGRGIALRSDHGPQYTSSHFTSQIRAWGMRLSMALVAEPETNGVVERFIRTLKQQVVHGINFNNLDEVQRAIATFVDQYNHQWRVEKNGFLTPMEVRQRAALATAA